MKKISIIGGGFAGLSAASLLARDGFRVDVYEKNNMPGGRARKLEAMGFTFDMGPTWYWMPDVFERYFGLFGKNVSEYYQLKRISPSYRVYFGKNEFIDVPSELDRLYDLFEKYEPGSSKKLARFLKDAAFKYDIGINRLVHKPSLSVLEFIEPWLVRGITHFDFFRSLSTYVNKLFRHPYLRQILEFPVIFLGSVPGRIPAFYNLMNYADLVLGTWYPHGGMFRVVEAMVKLAEENGAKIHLNSPVTGISIKDGIATGIRLNGTVVDADMVLGAADYHFIETKLLETPYQSYSEKYWSNREMAPSALLFYLGINKKLKGLLHHNLFFDTDFNQHASDIYEKPRWPEDPALYVSCSTKTDETSAPPGHENLIVLIPVATDMPDSTTLQEHYYDLVISRLEKITGQNIKDHVVFKKIYGHNAFISDYNSFRGNAYGLANTLKQTALFKPRMKSRKVKNLYYAGQLTVPGPGVPPVIISGEVAAKQVINNFRRAHHEKTV
ncbi:MAG: phytoene desaturase family protein [bacterium]